MDSKILAESEVVTALENLKKQLTELSKHLSRHKRTARLCSTHCHELNYSLGELNDGIREDKRDSDCTTDEVSPRYNRHSA